MKKKRLLIIVMSVMAVLACIIAGAAYNYLKDYYPAQASAVSYLVSTEDVTVYSDKNDNVIFIPDESIDTHTGFIFYPGGKVQYYAYTGLLHKLSGLGYTCVLVKMPANLAILDIDRAEGIKDDFPSVDRWLIGGHSLGGAVASMYVADHPEEYDGLVLLGAYSNKDISNTDMSVLLITATEDKILSLDKYDESIVNYPSGYEEVSIEGGCHSYFGDYGMQKGDGEPTITCDEQHAIIIEYIDEWIKKTAS